MYVYTHANTAPPNLCRHPSFYSSPFLTLVVSVAEDDVPYAGQVALRPVLQSLVLFEDLFVLLDRWVGDLCTKSGGAEGDKNMYLDAEKRGGGRAGERARGWAECELVFFSKQKRNPLMCAIQARGGATRLYHKANREGVPTKARICGSIRTTAGRNPTRPSNPLVFF